MLRILSIISSVFVFTQSCIGLQSLSKFEGKLVNHSAYPLSSRFHQDWGKHDRSHTHQVFAQPTTDQVAKFLLKQDESVRVDILRTFTGIPSLSSAKVLDEHYNPLDSYYNIRRWIDTKDSQALFGDIRNASQIEVLIDGVRHTHASEMLRGISHGYDDFTDAFPNQRNTSSVDFLCGTEFGYVTIEVQIPKKGYWDRRAMSYLASIYGLQMKPGDPYTKLQDVIGINILGDGSTPLWNDGDYKRDYVFKNQRSNGRILPCMRLIQYSLGDVDFEHEDLKKNDRLRQWIEFFRSAHLKEVIPPSVDEPVHKAYEIISVAHLKRKHPEVLKTSYDFMTNYDEHNTQMMAKGKAEGKAEGEKEKSFEIALNMLADGLNLERVAKLTNLPPDDIKRRREDRRS